MLFKQNGKITLSEEWKKRFTTGNMAGAWTIEEFTTAVNMDGTYIYERTFIYRSHKP
jgi:hypothetical protein